VDTLTVGTLPGKNNTTDFSVFPSLFTDNLMLGLPDQKPSVVDVIIYDISGKSVFQNRYALTENKGSLYIDTGRLNSGIYFVSVYSSSDVKVFKCVKAADSRR
jgi:hypothetical protein